MCTTRTYPRRLHSRQRLLLSAIRDRNRTKTGRPSPDGLHCDYLLWGIFPVMLGGSRGGIPPSIPGTFKLLAPPQQSPGLSHGYAKLGRKSRDRGVVEDGDDGVHHRREAVVRGRSVSVDAAGRNGHRRRETGLKAGDRSHPSPHRAPGVPSAPVAPRPCRRVALLPRPRVRPSCCSQALRAAAPRESRPVTLHRWMVTWCPQSTPQPARTSVPA